MTTKNKNILTAVILLVIVAGVYILAVTQAVNPQ
jgi:hypothetical protein